MKELLHKRTFTQKHHQLDTPNQYRLEAHIGHIHYRDGALKDGAFNEIDTTLNYNPVSKLYSMTNASYEAEISLNGKIRFHNIDHSMEFALDNPNKVEAEPYLGSEFGKIGKALIWKNIIQDGGHQIVEVRNGSLAKIFRFDKKPLSNIIDFNVSLSDIQLDKDIDVIEHNHQIGKSFIRKPRAWNHRGKSVDIRLVIRKGGTAQKIIPQKFINETFNEFGAWLECDTTTSYYVGSGAGTGVIDIDATDGRTWSQMRTASGTALRTDRIFVGTNKWDNSQNWRMNILRGLCPVDTSGIPDSALLTAASFYLQRDTSTWGSNPRTVATVLSTQDDPTVVTAADYGGFTVDSPDEGASRIGQSDFTFGEYKEIPLNSIGVGWINKTGYTKFGFREGRYDIDNTDEEFWQDGNVAFYNIDNSDPYLDVTYSESNPLAGFTQFIAHQRNKVE